MNELVQVIEANGLDEAKTNTIMEGFTGFLEEAKKYEERAKAITITSPEQKEEMKEARSIRLELKSIRTKAEGVRKQLKESVVREGKAIDGIANIIKAVIVPIEQHLDNQEKYVERIEKERKEKLENERIVLIESYVEDVALFNLQDMSEEGFTHLLESSKNATEARIEAERKAEAERIAKEEAERKEQERIRKENAALKAEADAKQKEIDDLRKKEEAKEEKEREKIRKEEQAKAAAEELQAGERYQEFLTKHGYSEESKYLFHIVRDSGNEETKLYKLVATLTDSD